MGVALTQSRTNLILERIAAIQASIALDGLGSIQVAYAYALSDVPNANVPFVVNIIQPSQIPHFSPGLVWPEDEIDMYFCLQRVEGDVLLQQNIMQAARWRDEIIAKFAAHTRLSPPDAPGVPDFDFIVDAYLTQWQGLPFKAQVGTAEYLTHLFRLKVREYFFTPVTG